MLYLIKSDTGVNTKEELSNGIINLDEIAIINILDCKKDKCVELVIRFKHDRVWVAKYKTVENARAALADILLNMGRTNAMALDIDVEVV